MKSFSSNLKKNILQLHHSGPAIKNKISVGQIKHAGGVSKGVLSQLSSRARSGVEPTSECSYIGLDRKGSLVLSGQPDSKTGLEAAPDIWHNTQLGAELISQ